MNDNIWTMLKVLFTIVVSILIYNYFNGEFSPNIAKSTLIDSSLEMLKDILAESVNDNETGKSARKNFQSFSEKVSKGEITPEEFQDVAAAILNIRMEKGVNIDSDLQKIILDMKFAQKEAELNKMSGKASDAQYESIALKIEELASFQEENKPILTLNDHWSKITPAAEPQMLKKGSSVEIIIAYDPVEPVRVSPTSPTSLNRRESSTTIIESSPRVVPLIKITDNLDVLVDSTMIIHLDSVKLILLKKSLERLQHAKTLKKIIMKKIDAAAESPPSDN